MKNYFLLYYFLLFSIVSSFSQTVNKQHSDFIQKIKNGEDVLIQDHPYQADLGGCGGTIIGPTWIVTAEHCVGGIVGRRIGVGYTRRSDRTTGQTARVKRVINFNCPGYCDLSLLELESPLDLSGPYVKAIRYASADVFTQGFVQEGKDCYATGWGQLDPNRGGSPDHLQGALLKFGKVQLSDFRIRVEETEGRMVCRGDSGGPLVVYNSDQSERILVGAVSGGEGTPCTDYGFWGNVANASSWIEEQTGIPPYRMNTLNTLHITNEDSVTFWPNPAKDKVYVSASTFNKTMSFQLFSVSGKRLLTSKGSKTIDLTSVPEGVYLLQDATTKSSKMLAIKR